jgi:hypothetical protein
MADVKDEKKEEKKKDPWMYSTVAMIVLLFISQYDPYRHGCS